MKNFHNLTISSFQFLYKLQYSNQKNIFKIINNKININNFFEIKTNNCYLK